MAWGTLKFEAEGYFYEKEFGNPFEFKKLPNEEQYDWGRKQGATHLIFVGGPECMWNCRYAKVKKTVCYVATEEDDFGNTVWEKWLIKGRKEYRNQDYLYLGGKK